MRARPRGSIENRTKQSTISVVHCAIFVVCLLDLLTPAWTSVASTRQSKSPLNPFLTSLIKERANYNASAYENRVVQSRLDSESHRGGNFSARQKRESRSVCDCGIQQYAPNRVFYGTETYPNEYPWMAALVYPDAGTIMCGASIIGQRFALTAAHCFNNREILAMFILVGVHDLRIGGVMVPVLQIVVHPLYTMMSKDYDVALVEFALPVTFGPNIGPICLPFPDPHLDLNWQEVIVMGWGQTPFAISSFTLQEANLVVVPRPLCQMQYPQTTITERMICAWGYSGTDACKGDSGGPLVYNHAGRWYVVGVVSFGKNCGEAMSAGVYTKINQYLDWILRETEDTACLSPPDHSGPAPLLAYPWLKAPNPAVPIPNTTNKAPMDVPGNPNASDVSLEQS